MLGKELNIVFFFGGQSSEHNVSLASAQTIFPTLCKLKHHIWPIAIDRNGDWYLVDAERVFQNNGREVILNPQAFLAQVALCPTANGALLLDLVTGQQLCSHLDLMLPMIHGRGGEDGALQGLAQLCGLPCCGSPISAAALSMDKEQSKRLLRDYGLPIVPFLCLHADAAAPSWQYCQQQLDSKLLFVKPTNQGSSVGISRITCAAEWQPALQLAWQHGSRLLVEPAINGREIELALLERKGCIDVSGVGEVCIDDGNFYDYRYKYLDSQHVQLDINCDLPLQLAQAIKQCARQAFRLLGLRGFARIDFFLEADGTFYLNELNSLPGFTARSMFPRLWQQANLELESLVAAIIDAAFASFTIPQS